MRHTNVDIGEVTLHTVTAGSGDPVVLLHGWPQTWYAWRHLIPPLAERYHVIAPDLRGIGESGRPSQGYDKQTMAEDIHRLLARLDLADRPVRLVGHDWGGVIAYHYAATHRRWASHLVAIAMQTPAELTDVPLLLPGGNPLWHFAFHTTAEIPELLLDGKEEAYLRWWFGRGAASPTAVPDEAVEEYVAAYGRPGAMAASLRYYRAVFDDIASTRRHAKDPLDIPVLAVGGDAHGGDGVAASMRRVANDVRNAVISDCGHWVPDEQPAQLLRALRTFLSVPGDS